MPSGKKLKPKEVSFIERNYKQCTIGYIAKKLRCHRGTVKKYEKLFEMQETRQKVQGLDTSTIAETPRVR